MSKMDEWRDLRREYLLQEITTYLRLIGPIFKGHGVQKCFSYWLSWPLKMGPIGFPEMSVRN
jgi:hypothetical protein